MFKNRFSCVWHRYVSLSRFSVVLPLFLGTGAVQAQVPTAAPALRVTAKTAVQSRSTSAAHSATDAEVTKMGVVRGDYVIPYSTLGTAAVTSSSFITPGATTSGNDTIASGLHTNYLIQRPGRHSGLFPAQGTGEGGSYYPADIIKAYRVPQNGGSGTIVIVDAFDYPTALADFNKFSQTTKLNQETSTDVLANSNKVFQVVYATGRKPNNTVGTLKGVDVNRWNMEAALDIEWAHAMAPNAKIILVEARSNSGYDLFYAAILRANTLPNVRQVSMSFSGDEDSSISYFDPLFTRPGIVYFASTGDVGGKVQYPASSPNVVAVGGTTLNLDAQQNWVSESAWNGSGGGPSAYEPLPVYQTGITAGGVPLTNRGTPDIALVADPNTGVYVLYNGSSYKLGGTSVSCPILAGIVNARGSQYSSTVAQLTNLYGIYNMSSPESNEYLANFHDITSGKAGSFSALVGYDYVTGIGSPNGVGGL